MINGNSNGMPFASGSTDGIDGKIDEAYLRNLFKAHSKTPIEAFYLETGKLPLRYILKSRRLMYWWHIEKLREEKMLSKFLKAQKNNPVRNDWILQVTKDKEEFNIDIDDTELKKMSKNVYKKYNNNSNNILYLEHFRFRNEKSIMHQVLLTMEKINSNFSYMVAINHI